MNRSSVQHKLCLHKFATLLAFGSLWAASGPAQAQAQTQQKPNILFIMGDDIGIMQRASIIVASWLGKHPTSTASGKRARCFMTYYAEQSCTAGRTAFFTGMHPVRAGMVMPQLPGATSSLLPGTPCLAKSLLDLGYNTGEFGKNHLGDKAAHCRPPTASRNSGATCITSTRCEQRKLPGHQQAPGRARPSCRHARNARSAGFPIRRARSIRGRHCAWMPPRPVIAMQVLRWHGEEPDCKDEGLDVGTVEDR